jgi:hypothetical protein
MPLINCPDCARQISDAAPVCLGCGRPMTRTASALEDSPPADGRGPHRCPKCAGGEFRKFSLLHQEQRATSTSTTTGLGVGYGGGGLGVGVGQARSQGVVITDLARRVAPPDRKAMEAESGVGGVATIVSIAVAMLVYAIAGGFVAALIGFFVSVFAMTIILTARAAPGVDKKYKAARTLWERSYMCLRCGATLSLEGNQVVDLSAQADAEIDELIRQGEVIQAVAIVKSATGLSLAEAHQRVIARQREIASD